MKSQKFILKNQYQERNIDRNYQYHKMNLASINSKVLSLLIFG